MGNKLTFPKDKHVVIVGGGYGGSSLASKLLKQGGTKFTVIDTRDHMHHNMAAIRAVAQPGFVYKTMVPFKPFLGDHFKHGKVVDIKPDSKSVLLKSGEEVTYDYLVLATGTTGPFPTKIKDESTEEACQKYEGLAQKVKNGESITVVGGGAAGVELAGEIASYYPEKKVSLIHSRNMLIDYPNITEKFRNKLMTFFKQTSNVDVILGEKVSNFKDLGDSGDVSTDTGRMIKSDVILNATGLQVNSDAYKNSALCDKVLSNGQLKVDGKLKVEGYDDIYAIGDCNNTPENKLAFLAEHHANYVFDSIAKKAAGKEVKEYKINSLPVACVLALSETVGMAQLTAGYLLPDFIANRMKAKGMFVNETWKKFGQTPPK